MSNADGPPLAVTHRVRDGCRRLRARRDDAVDMRARRLADLQNLA